MIASLSSRPDPKPRTLFVCVTRANDPTTRAPSLPVRPVEFTSHSPNRVLLPRGVPLPVRPQRDLAGRRRSSLVRRPTTLLGFHRFVPFAGLIPRTGGLSLGLFAPRTSEAAKRSRVLRRDLFSADGISAGPGPRAVGRRSSAPIYFRRGDRPLVEKSEICKSDRPGMSTRFDSWASLPSAVHRRSTRRPRR
jgi:hypothetical protein